MTSNTVTAAAELLRERLKELEAERAQLERALASLSEGRQGRRGPGRPRGSGASNSRGRKRGRKRNTRSDQAVKLIQANPGISASEIAKRLKIKPNYMYRVLGDLQKEGRVKKDGRSYSAA
jgi:predicted HTH transcriptional regulator